MTKARRDYPREIVPVVQVGPYLLSPEVARRLRDYCRKHRISQKELFTRWIDANIPVENV